MHAQKVPTEELPVEKPVKRKPPPPPPPKARSKPSAPVPPIKVVGVDPDAETKRSSLPPRMASDGDNGNAAASAPSAGTSANNATDGRAIPPRLPERPRATTFSTPAASPPPALPARSLPVTSATSALAVGASPSRTKTLPIASSSRQMGTAGPPRSLPPPPSADGYVPPVPPNRGPASGNSTPRRTPSIASTSRADDDEDDQEDPSGNSTSAQRATDDYPDSTYANRRPPAFNPPIRIHIPHHVYAFAVFGRYACVGSHTVRVYDTQLSDQPIYNIDLRETGLDFRIKEPRVSAMCFRPVCSAEDEGRYLWCGTTDGHLWELDIKTGQITDTRSFAHSSVVTNIFRYQKWFVSVEETGKAHIFKVGWIKEDLRDEDSKIPQLFRTIRLGDRPNFTKLVGPRLWTATPPAVRSTTSSSAKGPTIKIYSPFEDGNSAIPVTVGTPEWSGAVTSATILPMQPDVVYLGHEGGFISMWDAETCENLSVSKVSASDILSLEGVGERLWAGNRKGHIHVYDVSAKPWTTTNTWDAHPYVFLCSMCKEVPDASDQPVQTLVCDPWSIDHVSRVHALEIHLTEQAGRYILWSSSRETLHAWDGLLSIDWIGK